MLRPLFSGGCGSASAASPDSGPLYAGVPRFCAGHAAGLPDGLYPAGIEYKILQKSRAAAHEKRNVCALFTLRLYRGIPEKHLVRDLRQFPGVASIQER